MAIKLTWDDLILQKFTREESFKWLREWDWLVEGNVAPLFLTQFGDWYLLRPEGHVDQLDVLSGTIRTVAPTRDEFYAMVNQQEWQEEHLLSLMIFNLHGDGKIPGPGECYGFAPHPQLSGTIERKNVMVMAIHAWQSICSQTCRAGE